ncbi:glyoxalase [bacterium]|nr:glyoxalase [bacterium]
MITSLDHLVLVCPNIDEGELAYARILGREPDWRAFDSGSAVSVFQLENTALELMAPSGPGPVGRRLRDVLDTTGPGVKSVVFGCADLDAAVHRFSRRALNPSEPQSGESIDSSRGEVRSWRRARFDEAATHGVRMFLLQRSQTDPLVSHPAGPQGVDALDHIVINTHNPERAVALYGGRLGLPLALDRSNPAWDARLMFFQLAGVTVEIAYKISTGVSDQPDRIWGLAWRTDDIEATHARLDAQGVSVSELRPGRRPGTRVFTIRDGTLGVPTLMLSK